MDSQAATQENGLYTPYKGPAADQASQPYTPEGLHRSEDTAQPAGQLNILTEGLKTLLNQVMAGMDQTLLPLSKAFEQEAVAMQADANSTTCTCQEENTQVEEELKRLANHVQEFQSAVFQVLSGDHTSMMNQHLQQAGRTSDTAENA